MIFRQLFEPLSSTYTYLIGCEETRQCALVDPVYPTWERDRDLLRQLGLELCLTLETHVHADHITSARKLREEMGSRVGYPLKSECDCADLAIEEGNSVHVGTVAIEPIYTPGHTDDHFCYRVGDRVLTGDCLLIDGCGRTDFQNGDAGELYDSIHRKLFSLPGETLVYPGHDYNGRRVSCIAQEKARNPRLGGGRGRADYIALMKGLELAYPKFIDYAVPGNRQCGRCPEDLPEKLETYCRQMTESPQG